MNIIAAQAESPQRQVPVRPSFRVKIEPAVHKNVTCTEGRPRGALSTSPTLQYVCVQKRESKHCVQRKRIKKMKTRMASGCSLLRGDYCSRNKPPLHNAVALNNCCGVCCVLWRNSGRHSTLRAPFRMLYLSNISSDSAPNVAFLRVI